MTSVLSCKSRDEDSDFNLVNGKPLTAKDPGFYTAVSLLTQSPEGGQSYLNYCTGVIVQEDVIVTSAHCQNKVSGSYIKQDDSTDYSNLNEQKVSFRHPLFSSQYYYDISWLRPKKNISLKTEQYVPILEDASVFGIPGKITKAIVVGAGVSGPKEAGKRYYTEVDIKEFIDNNVGRAMIRAASKDGSVCFGDNGGPLYVEVDGKWHIAGILHGYDYNNKFDHSNKMVDANENFPSNIDLCKQKSDLLFSFLGFHSDWIKASARASNPNIMEIKFKESEKFGNDFKSWCEAPAKSDLAWISTRLILDELSVNSCEEAYKKITETKKMVLEFGGLAKAHPAVIKALMNFAATAVTELDLLQYYNDQHDINEFVNIIPDFKNLQKLKIENYVGFSSYAFIQKIPAPIRAQIDTFHFLPSITPDFDNDGEGRRDNKETENIALFPNLRELHLSYNGLQTAAFVSKLPKLEVLNLDFNNITDFKPVLTAKLLKQLSMVANPLKAEEFEKELKAKLPETKYQIGNAP